MNKCNLKIKFNNKAINLKKYMNKKKVEDKINF